MNFWLMNGLREFWEDENGMGTIEIVLIVVVLIGLVVVFKDGIGKLLDNIFKSINSLSNSVTG
ncbi:MAG: Flp1 family type IVb pilin [Eubacteriales bacterium]|nr:Flp1 family type IVb pilin [Eubacteriales bacterium]